MFALAAIAADVATPEVFVTAVFTPATKLTLGPLCAGAVKMTVALGTKLPFASNTVATSGPANAVLAAAFWPLPLVAMICDAGPAVLVNPKLAVVAAPDEATTK